MAHLKDLIVNGPVRATSKVYSPEFVGDLTGTATKATQDADGNVIDETYLPLSGGTLTGTVNLANGTWNNIGDDASIGDCNQAGCMGVKGLNGATGLYFTPYSGSKAQKLSIDGSGTATLTGNLSVAGSLSEGGTALSSKYQAKGSYASSSHTHNYAGSSSAGGAATSLSYFKNTSSVDVGLTDATANAIGYVLGTSGILGQNDGAIYKQVYSDKWIHEIYADYRTGQIALRGKNNGTWQAWRTVLDSSNYKTYCTPANIGAATSSHTHNYAGSSSAGGAATTALACTGNSATATKLKTARTISLTGSVTGSGSFDGSGNLSIATTTNHTHNYLPLSGGTVTGNLEFSNSGTTTRGVIGTVGGNDYWRIVGGATADNDAYLEIATADDGNEPIYVRQYSKGKFGTLTRTATLLDGSGNTKFPGKVTASSFAGALTGNVTGNVSGSSGSCTGNSATATKLKTARTISLTGSVTGSGTFDGSGNLSIATTTNHTHNYLPLAGGSMTGDVSLPITKSSKDVSLPVSGASMVITDITSLKDYKTYLGSYTHSGTWYNIISTRHRNGFGDGVDYGLYIRSALTSTGNLSWGKQCGKTSWQAERTILDSSNYTSYCTPANIGAAPSSHTHNYLPLSGGTMTGNILSSGSNLGNYSYPFNNAHIKYSLNLTDSTAGIYSNVAGNVLNTYNSSSIPYGTLPEYVTDKAIVFGNTSASSIYRGDYIEINSYSGWISANTSISIYSDEKVKNFTEDIETDEDKLIKIFDEIILRSYTYKSSKNNSLSIGLSGQELEQLCLDNDIDPEKYNFLNIRYNYRLDNGDGEENTKFYLKFITISYEELYALALLKIKRMEKEHISRLNQSETEIAELKTEMSEVNDKLNEIMTLLNSN